MDKKQIMVVEDEAVIALDIKANLIRLGYDVIAIVSTGEEAVLNAEKLRPDLILMDITLDGAMNGFEAAILINKNFDIPVIFITAHSDNEMLKRGQEAGGYGFIPKPYDARALRTTIEMAHARFADMIEIRRLNKELQQSIQKVEELRKFIPICLCGHHLEVGQAPGICPICKKTCFTYE